MSKGRDLKSFIHATAQVEQGSSLGVGTKVWANAHIRGEARIGENVTIGEGVYVGPGVEIGDNCKIQNLAQVFDPAKLGKGVFLGPGAILTNDRLPRAVSPDFSTLSSTDWSLVGVTLDDGCSIGAGAVCVAPLRVGKWSMVGAGSVVTHDVPDFALVMGNPARFVKWVGRTGSALVQAENNQWECRDTGERFRFVDSRMTPIEGVEAL